MFMLPHTHVTPGLSDGFGQERKRVRAEIYVSGNGAMKVTKRLHYNMYIAVTTGFTNIVVAPLHNSIASGVPRF